MESYLNKGEIKESKLIKIVNIILDVLYILIVVPLVIIEISIIFQKIATPSKIPNFFGYKVFIIGDDRMDSSIKKGDLVFTKNVNTDLLKNGDIIAFRNNSNFVTIHSITNITETDSERIFNLKTLENETNDTKQTLSSRVEGKLVRKFSGIGQFLLFIIKPISIIVIFVIIFSVGGFAYYFAKKLDDRDLLLTKAYIENDDNYKDEENYDD